VLQPFPTCTRSEASEALRDDSIGSAAKGKLTPMLHSVCMYVQSGLGWRFLCTSVTEWFPCNSSAIRAVKTSKHRPIFQVPRNSSSLAQSARGSTRRGPQYRKIVLTVPTTRSRPILLESFIRRDFHPCPCRVAGRLCDTIESMCFRQ
jgi:hypothetical protein